MRQDTICALCTAPGKGALAVIRVSGPEASKKIRRFARLPKALESHRVYTRIFKEGKTPLDQVVLTYFAERRSFTGEETFEISCHGGPLVYSRILQALLKEGLRMAEPGEFTLRAFYNGKTDLVQAEGLLQLIESQSERARRSAFFQMQGQLSLKLKELEEKWLHLLSHLEADIDFSTEGLSVLSEKDMEKALNKLLQTVCGLIDRYQPFESLQKGLTVGFFGPVNSGKSTLFNRLLEEEKAIVTAEEGTTRDIVEGQIQNSQIHLSLRDTAGLRKTSSLAEKTGQDKTRKLFFTCEVPVVVLEAHKLLALAKKGKSPLKTILSEFDGRLSKRRNFSQNSGKAVKLFLKKGLLIVTKKDLCQEVKKIEILNGLSLSVPSTKVFYFSNVEKSEKGDFSRFKKKLFSLSFSQQKEDREGDFFITSLRHFNGLQKMEEALREALHLQKGLGEKDLMALHLRQGLASLYEITGRQLDDQVLDTLFKKFCIGK